MILGAVDEVGGYLLTAEASRRIIYELKILQTLDGRIKNQLYLRVVVEEKIPTGRQAEEESEGQASFGRL